MTVQEFLSQPDKRDLLVFPITPDEQTAMAQFDTEGHFNELPDVAATLVFKWHTAGNYLISSQSLRSALVAIRPLLGSAPAAVTDPSKWNSQSARDMREGRPTHSELQELNKSALAEHDQETEKLNKAAEEIGRDDAFRECLVKVETIVVGHPSGKPDYLKTFKARQAGYENLKAVFPEHAQQIDAAIAELQKKQRM